MTQPFRALLIFALALIAGGYSESTAILLGILPLAVPVFRRRILFAWWLGLGIALVILVFTPGAQLRAAGGLKTVDEILYAWLTTWVLVPERWLGNPLGLMLAFFAGYAYPIRLARGTVRTMWLVAMGCMVATMLMVTRGNGGASVWTLPLPTLLVTIATWGTGCAWGRRTKRKRGQMRHHRGERWLWGTVAGIALVIGVALVDRTQFAVRWQQRDMAIRQGLRMVTVLDDRDSFNPPIPFYVACLRLWYNAELEVVG